ncbi:9942_t:CDS:2 [Paraglomus occultum]|uniref:9942_t:CDS:1 n=1 Tax=Paraglomus occultum TaxID=144539 RepID=A0A9N9AR40_9GLOM|nr:9942_t:CDS:2 [Paraglomus occultum]
MTTLTLSCLLMGDDPYANVFTVDIDDNKLVSHLKKAIKQEQPQTFANVDSKNLKLWKVNIPLDEPEPNLSLTTTNKFNITIREGLPDVKLLSAWDDISDYFSGQPPKKHVHIVVQPEPSSGVQAEANENTEKSNSKSSSNVQTISNVNEINACKSRCSVVNICLQSMVSTTTDLPEETMYEWICKRLKKMFGSKTIETQAQEVIIDVSQMDQRSLPITNANETNRCDGGFALLNYCQQNMVSTSTGK